MVGMNFNAGSNLKTRDFAVGVDFLNRRSEGWRAVAGRQKRPEAILPYHISPRNGLRAAGRLSR